MNVVLRVRISRQRRRVRRSAIHVFADLISITSFEFTQIEHRSHGGSCGTRTAFELVSAPSVKYRGHSICPVAGPLNTDQKEKRLWVIVITRSYISRIRGGCPSSRKAISTPWMGT